MIKMVLARIQQGHRTTSYPKGPPPVLPDRFRGRPVILAAECRAGCSDCEAACPTGAIEVSGGVRIDLGKCLFCAECEDACPEKKIMYTTDYRLAAGQRDHLVLHADELRLAEALGARLRKVLGRSLKLRVVSAGGCNGCEADTNVLTTIGWDIGRFGIEYVASPRHADGLLITGPVTENMRLALEKTYDAVPDPKIVIAVGACAISGGPLHRPSRAA